MVTRPIRSQQKCVLVLGRRWPDAPINNINHRTWSTGLSGGPGCLRPAERFGRRLDAPCVAGWNTPFGPDRVPAPGMRRRQTAVQTPQRVAAATGWKVPITLRHRTGRSLFAGTVARDLPMQTSTALRNRDRRAKMTTSVLAAHQARLRRFNGQSDVVVNMPMVAHGVESHDVTEMLGDPPPSSSRSNGENLFSALLEAVPSPLRGGDDHRHSLSACVLDAVFQSSHRSRIPMFQAVLVLPDCLFLSFTRLAGSRCNAAARTAPPLSIWLSIDRLSVTSTPSWARPSRDDHRQTRLRGPGRMPTLSGSFRRWATWQAVTPRPPDRPTPLPRSSPAQPTSAGTTAGTVTPSTLTNGRRITAAMVVTFDGEIGS